MKKETRFSTKTRNMITLLAALGMLIAGIIERRTVLALAGLLILCLMTGVWLVRRNTVLTIDQEGIRFVSPFSKVYFRWEEVASCGSYSIRNGKVQLEDNGSLIYVSNRAAYKPGRYDHVTDRRNIHFRWDSKAWEAIRRFAKNLSA